MFFLFVILYAQPNMVDISGNWTTPCNSKVLINKNLLTLKTFVYNKERVFNFKFTAKRKNNKLVGFGYGRGFTIMRNNIKCIVPVIYFSMRSKLPRLNSKTIYNVSAQLYGTAFCGRKDIKVKLIFVTGPWRR
jgi:hypothetical protein